MHSPNFVSPKLRFFLSFVTALSIAEQAVAENWQGFNKIEFTTADRAAFLVEPKSSAPGRPWIWRMEFFGHQPQADIALLNKGFHVAYVDVQNMYGAPASMSIMDAMYRYVVSEYKLSDKVVLEGFSRGGLFSINWAARNPMKVACIYNDAPVCDFTSCVVPIEENSLLLQSKYQSLGGSMLLISKPNCNHHPHTLEDPLRIVNFVFANTGFTDQLIDSKTPFGYDYFSLRNGLQRCRTKFETEKNGRVAFLGGSITASRGWRDEVCEDLKRRFPDTEFDFVSAGIPSLGSTPGAFRFQRDVLANGPVDLLFEEAAVNDDTNGFSDVEQVRGMEGIVRQALLSNPKMDIVLLHFVDPGKIAEIRKGKSPAVIVNHEKVADHYRIPSINLAREVTERIEAGEFTWEKDFRDLHPTPFGHSLYAASIGRMMSAAWGGNAAVALSSTTDLPKPLDTSSYFYGRLVSPVELLQNNELTLVRGFRIEANWKPEGKAGTRPGFVNVPALIADSAGATLTLKFKGRGVGVFVAAGPDTGRVEYRIDGGDWQKQELFTQWSAGLHLPWAKMLASELSEGAHELELRVSQDADDRSQGHAVRIIHFLINEPR